MEPVRGRVLTTICPAWGYVPGGDTRLRCCLASHTGDEHEARLQMYDQSAHKGVEVIARWRGADMLAAMSASARVQS
jgi:hypothetical protein